MSKRKILWLKLRLVAYNVYFNLEKKTTFTSNVCVYTVSQYFMFNFVSAEVDAEIQMERTNK